jgi:hypothetical protein
VPAGALAGACTCANAAPDRPKLAANAAINIVFFIILLIACIAKSSRP